MSFCVRITLQVVEGKVIFLGFSEAFDTVTHSIPVDELSSCGMRGFTVNWLKGRAQRVAVNVAMSDW